MLVIVLVSAVIASIVRSTDDGSGAAPAGTDTPIGGSSSPTPASASPTPSESPTPSSTATGSGGGSGSVPSSSPSSSSAPPTQPVADPDSAAMRFHWSQYIGGDEFDYTGKPDPKKWLLYDGVGHAGQGVRSPSAFSVENGYLRISGDSKGTTGGMAAAFAQRTSGKWEVRMRVSERDPKYHPVLILWPDSNNWPCDSEIDFAEGWGSPKITRFVLISGCDATVTDASTPLDQTEWHTYAVSWSPNQLEGYIDGQRVFRTTDTKLIPTARMHLTAQLDWFPDGTATKASWMELDWVRVYS